MKRYFYITIHFSPDYEGKIFLKQQDGLYINAETGELYRKRLLYDFGWGQENGFELMPQLSFDELIQLVEKPMVLPQKKFWQKYTKEERCSCSDNAGLHRRTCWISIGQG